MSDPMTGSPLFTAVPDQRRYPSLSGHHQAEIVVVGGGIVGVMTAWRLAQHGRSVSLLEQHHLATGDTGFTTSFVTRIPDTSLADLAHRHGLEFVRQVLSATRQAQQYLEQTIGSEGIDCDWVGCSSLYCSYQPYNQVLRAEWNVAQLVDPSASFVTSENDADLRSPIVEAIRFYHEGYFNVRKFIFGLLERPNAKRITIHEESAVNRIAFEKNGVSVFTDQGSIACQQVVVCTGAPPTWLPEFQHVVTPKVTYVIAAQYDQGVPIADHISWDTDHPYQYFRRLNETTMILGGADRPSHQASPTAYAQLERFLEQHFGPPSRMIARWSGTLFETADGLPYVAEHPHHRGQLYLATGLAGNGMVMGTMAGMMLADRVALRITQPVDLFEFSRTKTTIPRSPSATQQTPVSGEKLSPRVKAFWRFLIPLIFMVAIALPAFVFFHSRGGLQVVTSTRTLPSFAYTIFPLFGLYAFTLVWIQVMLGSNMDFLRRVYSWIERFHRTEGVFVFLFAWTHPMLLLIGVGLKSYFPPVYVSPRLVPFVYLGYLQFFLINLTVVTALLRRTAFMKKYWRKLHVINYVTFFSIWTHSWFLGTDVHASSLRYVWVFYILTVVASTLGRIWRVRHSTPAASSTPTPLASAEHQSPTWTNIARLDQLTEGHPFCANVNGQALAIFKIGDKVYAMNNTCSHAGGPLCEGALHGNIVECPLHGSQFDVTTGQVKQGPAIRPQKTYPVRLQGDEIQVQA